MIDKRIIKWYNEIITLKGAIARVKQVGRTPQPLTDEQRKIAAEYLDSNLSGVEMAEKYGKPKSSIVYWAKKLRKERERDKIENDNR